MYATEQNRIEDVTYDDLPDTQNQQIELKGIFTVKLQNEMVEEKSSQTLNMKQEKSRTFGTCRRCEACGGGSSHGNRGRCVADYFSNF